MSFGRLNVSDHAWARIEGTPDVEPRTVLSVEGLVDLVERAGLIFGFNPDAARWYVLVWSVADGGFLVAVLAGPRIEPCLVTVLRFEDWQNQASARRFHIVPEQRARAQFDGRVWARRRGRAEFGVCA